MNVSFQKSCVIHDRSDVIIAGEQAFNLNRIFCLVDEVKPKWHQQKKNDGNSGKHPSGQATESFVGFAKGFGIGRIHQHDIHDDNGSC